MAWRSVGFRLATPNNLRRSGRSIRPCRAEGSPDEVYWVPSERPTARTDTGVEVSNARRFMRLVERWLSRPDRAVSRGLSEQNGWESSRRKRLDLTLVVAA